MRISTKRKIRTKARDTNMSEIIDKEDFFQDKITSAYEERLFQAYEQHGDQAIEALKKENIEMYLRVSFSVLGKDVIREIMKSWDPNFVAQLYRDAERFRANGQMPD